MKKRIPENKIPKISPVYATGIGDFIETFNLDLSSKYGTISTNRMRRRSYSPEDAVPVDFDYFENRYYAVAGTHVFQGGDNPDDTFTQMNTGGAPTDIDGQIASLDVFNNSLYVVGTGGGDGVYKYNGGWTTVSASGLASSSEMHLTVSSANRLYITDSEKVVHVNSSDVLTLTGTGTLDTDLGPEWTPTVLEKEGDNLFICYLNTLTGAGLMYQWDGETENTPLQRIEMDAGAMAGTVFNNTLHIIDTRGRLMARNAVGFSQVGSLFIDTDIALRDTDETISTTERFIHPNGMTTTDDGRILLLVNAVIENSEQTLDIPSGVYCYDPNIGVYHTNSPTKSVSSTVLDYGSQRLSEVGGIFYRRPNLNISNGNYLVGAGIYVDATNIEYGIFYNNVQFKYDTENDMQSWGYFISEIHTDSLETWQNIYSTYQVFNTDTDKITIKYKTRDTERVFATISWSNTTSFLTNDDISTVAVGDEVQVLNGYGAGKSAHITSITSYGSGYSVILDDVFTGAEQTAVVSIDKWIKAGDIVSTDTQQYKSLACSEKNQSPVIFVKVCMQFTGKNMLYSTTVNSKSTIKE